MDNVGRGGSLAVKQPTQSEDGGSNPASPLQFLPIDKKLATGLIIQNHYLHRKAPIKWAFGIEDALGRVVGVCCIGKPASWSACCGVVGEKYADLKTGTGRNVDVYELNRLWISDEVTEHCIESKFVAWCLRRLKKENPNAIIISYADGSITNPVTGKNHVGVVYKAVGFIYSGLSAKFTDITLKGFGDHRSVPKSMRGEKVNNRRTWANAPTMGEYAVVRKTRSRKHRYIWLANPADKKLIVWEQQPYPTVAAEQDQVRVEANENAAPDNHTM
jgi:hypothetical protein